MLYDVRGTVVLLVASIYHLNNEKMQTNNIILFL